MLDGKKTYIVAGLTFIVAICHAGLTYLETGNIEIEAVILSGIALTQIFLRSGIKKNGVV